MGCEYRKEPAAGESCGWGETCEWAYTGVVGRVHGRVEWGCAWSMRSLASAPSASASASASALMSTEGGVVESDFKSSAVNGTIRLYYSWL